MFKRELNAHYAALTQNVMHWAYGTGWGGLYGLSEVELSALEFGPKFQVLPPKGCACRSYP